MTPPMHQCIDPPCTFQDTHRAYRTGNGLTYSLERCTVCGRPRAVPCSWAYYEGHKGRVLLVEGFGTTPSFLVSEPLNAPEQASKEVFPSHSHPAIGA